MPTNISGEKVWNAWQRIQRLEAERPVVLRVATTALADKIFVGEKGPPCYRSYLKCYTEAIAEVDLDFADSYARSLDTLGRLVGTVCDLRFAEMREGGEIEYSEIESAHILECGIGERWIRSVITERVLLRPLITFNAPDPFQMEGLSILHTEPHTGDLLGPVDFTLTMEGLRRIVVKK